LQIGTPQIRILEVGSLQISPLEVGITKMNRSQIGSRKINACQCDSIFLYDTVVNSPFIIPIALAAIDDGIGQDIAIFTNKNDRLVALTSG
jgi:hypothetical protein